jgi:hypothetical protein
MVTEVVIDKKKYVIVSAIEYNKLQKKAALFDSKEELFSLEEGKKYSLSLIKKWSKEKQK